MLRPAILLCLALVGAACSGGTKVVGPTGTSASTPSVTATSPSPTVSNPQALVASLPAGCHKAVPAAEATIAFVADGRAWAVGPDGSDLTCVFEVDQPGPFVWGPRGDRVALSDLEVRGVGADIAAPPLALEPESFSWGRPNGIAIVYVDEGGTSLKKDLLEEGQVVDVTPQPDLAYEHVIYHPSGLAIAFTAEGPDGSAIWVSSNNGEDPQRLLFTVSGTEFGPIAFDLSGTNLFYGARLPGGASIVGVKPMSPEPPNEGLWLGDQEVLTVLPGPAEDLSAVALDAGTDCSDRTAIFASGDGGPGQTALPGAKAPTAAIGWLDDQSLMVAEGGCDEPFDLWIASSSGAAPILVATGVLRAATRVPEPTPPPALPDIGVEAGFA
jgi:hypothetical protein